MRPALTTVSLGSEQPSYLLLPVQATAHPDQPSTDVPGEGTASQPGPADAAPSTDLPATGSGLGRIGLLTLLLAAAGLLGRRGRPARVSHGQFALHRNDS
jgi:hypothetical protein